MDCLILSVSLINLLFQRPLTNTPLGEQPQGDGGRTSTARGGGFRQSSPRESWQRVSTATRVFLWGLRAQSSPALVGQCPRLGIIILLSSQSAVLSSMLKRLFQLYLGNKEYSASLPNIYNERSRVLLKLVFPYAFLLIRLLVLDTWTNSSLSGPGNAVGHPQGSGPPPSPELSMISALSSHQQLLSEKNESFVYLLKVR